MFAEWFPQCLHWPFCPGVFIAFLAFVAAIAAFRKDPGRRERALWIFLFLLLMCGEVWMMSEDHEKNDAAHKADIELQIKGFKDIGTGIEDAIRESDRNFTSTMGKTEEVLKNITGGDSFGIVVPQNFGMQIPLVVWNHGSHPLLGVTITIARTQEPDWGSSLYKPISVGTVGPNNYAPVPNVLITPMPEGKSGIDHYWIMISAQNGTVSEGLDFRKNRKNVVPWAYRYSITKDTPINKAGMRIPKGIPKNATVMKFLLNRAWSDEVDAPH